MKHIIQTDNDNYIIGLDLSNEGVVVPEEVFYSADLTCWKYKNKKFTFDEAKKERLETIQRNESEIVLLKKQLADSDYVVTKIAEGVATAEEYQDILAQRKQWRNRIRELEA